MSATQHQKALTQASHVEEKYGEKFAVTGIPAKSPDEIANQKILKEKRVASEKKTLEKYQNHIKDYLESVKHQSLQKRELVHKSPLSKPSKHETGVDRYSQRASRIRAKAMGLRPLETKRKNYPTQVEVDKYLKLVASIENQKNSIGKSLHTQRDRIIGHYSGRRHSVSAVARSELDNL